MAGQDAVATIKSDIQTRETTPVSILPSGLLENLTDQEVTELMAYMRTVKQMGK